ncbi:hypothetical protein FAX15_25485 (plasmid) [Escherichia coli]|nr:hypothetical protein [Escherichia coli]EFN6768092.1 hypothetical protein [Escherichia coli O39:H21]EFB9807682.1 hypothetical protein [Escherichia coli]EFN7868620.1 hypothetical protein [Escherichia coli]RBL46214.1 hypothetical protein CCZ07_25890 [Escherichia coli]
MLLKRRYTQHNIQFSFAAISTCTGCNNNCRTTNDRVEGGITPAVLSHHRTCGSAYGGSC